MRDVEKTIISQYSSAPTINHIIGAANEAIAPEEELALLYDKIWNVDTANEQGLYIWARIVGAQRTFRLPEEIVGGFFGFSQARLYPFDDQPFYNDGGAADANFELNAEEFRIAILLKALCNISSCDAHTINRVVKIMFASRGEVSVVDRGDMVMRFQFDFTLTPLDYAYLARIGDMLRPAGVLVDIQTP